MVEQQKKSTQVKQHVKIQDDNRQEKDKSRRKTMKEEQMIFWSYPRQDGLRVVLRNVLFSILT